MLAEHLPGKSSPMSFIPIFPLSGGYRDIEDSATAFSGSREARFSLDPAVAPSSELLTRPNGTLPNSIILYGRTPGS